MIRINVALFELFAEACWKDCFLPWTAYLVNFKNQRRKLLAEYEAYKSRNRPA